MNKNTFLSVIIFVTIVQITTANKKSVLPSSQQQEDSARIAELDRYWENLNKTVIEGDFEAYKKCFHKDAVIVFASGENKTSVPISTALEGWKEGFKSTREGKISVNVEFRFS